MEGFTTTFITPEKIPLVIQPTDSSLTREQFHALIARNQQPLKELLTKHGGLLFRNFPVQNENDFADVIKHLKTGKFVDYIGGDSPRNKIREGIYTSTEAPPSIKIPLHNELSFVKNFPKYIYFYCHIAPEAKGETILGDARKIFRSIDENVKKRFADKGLKYVSCYYDKSALMDFINKLQPSHKPWRQVFETTDKKEVERKCVENEFGYKWNKNNWLRIDQTRPAFLTHPETKEEVWFNQVHLYDFNPKLLGLWRYAAAKIFYCQKHMRLHEVFFGDDSPIPRKDIYHILDVLDNNTIRFPWQKGDILLLDNILTMHGRETFTGKRRVMTAMTS